jgi:hypothetical protein
MNARIAEDNEEMNDPSKQLPNEKVKERINKSESH